MAADEGTYYEGIKREVRAVLGDFVISPRRAIMWGLLIALIYGVTSIAPRAFGDAYNWLIPLPIEDPYSGTAITYSNFVPLETDVIDLDHAGSLTPAIHNARVVKRTSDGSCVPAEIPLPYSEGIVLVLNASVTFVPHPIDKNAIRGIEFPNDIPADQYLTFTRGKTHKIRSGGRAFVVTLSRINDLSSEQNGEYHSYIFDINEE